jgi:hypothetical protein
VPPEPKFQYLHGTLSDENTAFYVSLFFIIINFQIFNKNKKYSKKCFKKTEKKDNNNNNNNQPNLINLESS